MITKLDYRTIKSLYFLFFFFTIQKEIQDLRRSGKIACPTATNTHAVAITPLLMLMPVLPLLLLLLLLLLILLLPMCYLCSSLNLSCC
jgi:hypothetical protein